ncbi:MAG: tripartite tricarboxylate transporter substrate binding protein [Burkholderiales bacterium]|nr:tripartite tricarboxylate transporter substrate binding protein [Burkholderiales bacterium]
MKWMLVLIGLVFSCVGAHAQTQPFPQKPVKIIVPYPPGGMDILYRALAVELSTKWGQPVIVENRAGADSRIGAEAVAKAAPDGYTILATGDFTFVANRFLFAKLPYDPDKSFAPVSLVAQTEMFLLASESLPVNDLRELVAYARARPKQVSFGSFSKGSQADLAFLMLNKREGIDLLAVPYKGIGPVLAGMAGGEIQLGMGGTNVAEPLIQAKKLKVLAMTGSSRHQQFPNVKTATEQGFPYVISRLWYGVFVPAGTPGAVVNKISSDIQAVLANKEFVETKIASRGIRPLSGNAEDLARRIAEDVARGEQAFREAGIKPE